MEGFLVPHTAVRERLPTSAWEAAASQGMLAGLWKTASSVSCSSGISAGTESHCLADSRYPQLHKHAECSQQNRRQMQIGPIRPAPTPIPISQHLQYEFKFEESMQAFHQVSGVQHQLFPNVSCLINLKPSSCHPVRIQAL